MDAIITDLHFLLTICLVQRAAAVGYNLDDLRGVKNSARVALEQTVTAETADLSVAEEADEPQIPPQAGAAPPEAFEFLSRKRLAAVNAYKHYRHNRDGVHRDGVLAVVLRPTSPFWFIMFYPYDLPNVRIPIARSLSVKKLRVCCNLFFLF